MYEISSWMRVQIREARERIQSHRNVSLADVKRKKTAANGGGNAADDPSKTDDVSKETAASLENPGWFIVALFRYAAAIVPPKSRMQMSDSSGSSPSSTTANLADGEPVAALQNVESLRVSFQQCVIALGRIVNTDLLTRMDVFFDMFAFTRAGSITRQEVFDLSEAMLYIGHGEDVEVGDRRKKNSGEITNEEQLLRSVSGFLRRAISYGESADSSKDFVLPRNMFRVVVLEDEALEEFFGETVPASFRFTDGVELANPLRAISTHLASSTPMTPRAGLESASARLLAGSRSVAEGMSARVAQTIALGSQFVDRRMLTPIVRNASLSGAQPAGFSVSEDLAAKTQLSNAKPGVEPNAALVDEMARLLVKENEGVLGDEEEFVPENTPAVVSQQPQWVNAPLEPDRNSPQDPQDPYENLLDEVDELLGDINDDDDTGFAPLTGSNSSEPFTTKPSRNSQSKDLNDLDFQIDDDDDDDLTHLLRDN
ncbi:GTPase activating protein (GAP) [Kickxella alabastrina]|uniref:GTPase activating protein (GAP) n=1 Tax=Kickxella alabastrina TaxID=61397 RepID=A0ACC1IHX1_9FUNG|nr:GTPase activating protein (GAP) [Kickxella alabastrina]